MQKGTIHKVVFSVSLAYSTSMLSFLEKASGLQTLDTVLSKDYVNSTTRQEHGTLTCIYGPPPLEGDIAWAAAATKPQCNHVNYNSIQSIWNASLSHAPFLQTSLTTFTMVREPFDRLRSLFYYMYKYANTSTPWGKTMSTQRQYDMVLSGNFEKWIRLLRYEQGHGNIFRQYSQLNYHNVSKAISMIQQGNVTVYLNECFETSLEMLARSMSIAPSAVNNFVQSQEFRSNKGRYPNTTHVQQARAWFVDEYKFYDAAVKQFKRQLQSEPFVQFKCDL